MSQWNIAAKSKDEQDKVNVDLAASGVAYKERLNMPVVAEVVARGIKKSGFNWISLTPSDLARKKCFPLTPTDRPMKRARKEGGQRIDYIILEHCSQIERRAGQG